MGYSSSVRGQIEITVAGQDEDMTASQQVVIDLAKQHGLPTPTFETREGLTKEAIEKIKEIETSWFFDVEEEGFVPTGEEGKAYDFENEFPQMVKVVEEDGCLANGTIYLIGEGQGDASRFIVKDNVILHEEAELRWPDGTLATQVGY